MFDIRDCLRIYEIFTVLTFLTFYIFFYIATELDPMMIQSGSRNLCMFSLYCVCRDKLQITQYKVNQHAVSIKYSILFIHFKFVFLFFIFYLTSWVKLALYLRYSILCYLIFYYLSADI